MLNLNQEAPSSFRVSTKASRANAISWIESRKKSDPIPGEKYSSSKSDLCQGQAQRKGYRNSVNSD